ncbi:NUDIX domain-containing protein [Gordonia pseudamarae]|uniref:NUDIX domain-containing protein n=1 Tax=Gordonia TaxID=2053 RepID=UPI0019A85260|nr:MULTISPECIES: NUDIX domain-containing protein [Gordonia]MBD0023025.1 NUDIX domain-containing protein [Gordonia sp. (in: high G+C Gram-positive bacteria)]QHN27164.1 NUDIX domain-containing protein [Gordonia pseudamarae]
MNRIVVAAAIIDDTSRMLLLAQRRYPPEVAGLWELPGGKVEDGESRRSSLEREIAEELGTAIEAGEQVGAAVVLRPGLELVALRARLAGPPPRALDHTALCWVDAGRLRAMAAAGELVPADTAWVPDLLELLA